MNKSKKYTELNVLKLKDATNRKNLETLKIILNNVEKSQMKANKNFKPYVFPCINSKADNTYKFILSSKTIDIHLVVLKV
jgi:hypothetical protein